MSIDISNHENRGVLFELCLEAGSPIELTYKSKDGDYVFTEDDIVGDIPASVTAQAVAERVHENRCKRTRRDRDALLSETDVWALPDRTMSDAQIAYRQALRDITSQEGFPLDVTWPVKP